MTVRALAARFVDGPHVSAPDKAEELLKGWLADLEPAQSAEIRALLAEARTRPILLGIAEFSPYLFDLVRADAARAIRLLQCEPETHLRSLIETASREVRAAAAEVPKAVDPASDGRGSAEYKRDMGRVLVARALRKAAVRLGGLA